ncbi:MAG: hypothetical protein K0R09_187 [Clostridiales bacterium]|jgi:hypothetical protein|nr:hypothetical protein [Clostridiales bacterium]
MYNLDIMIINIDYCSRINDSLTPSFFTTLSMTNVDFHRNDKSQIVVNKKIVFQEDKHGDFKGSRIKENLWNGRKQG